MVHADRMYFELQVDGITPAQLEHIFAGCGTILKVVLRCSQGLAVLPGQKRTPGDRKYASVEFEHIQGARNALKLNGHMYYGRRLVVSFLIFDLEDVSDFVGLGNDFAGEFTRG